MTRADEMCFLRLWDTSPPAARQRYWADRRADYDAIPAAPQPRDFVAACARCAAPVVVLASDGSAQRRYCSAACIQAAYYRRTRERQLAAQRARRLADPVAWAARRKASDARCREHVLGYQRDRRAFLRTVPA